MKMFKLENGYINPKYIVYLYRIPALFLGGSDVYKVRLAAGRSLEITKEEYNALKEIEV